MGKNVSCPGRTDSATNSATWDEKWDRKWDEKWDKMEVKVGPVEKSPHK